MAMARNGHSQTETRPFGCDGRLDIFLLILQLLTQRPYSVRTVATAGYYELLHTNTHAIRLPTGIACTYVLYVCCVCAVGYMYVRYVRYYMRFLGYCINTVYT